MPTAIPRNSVNPARALLARNEEDRFTEYLYHLLLGWDDVLSEFLALCGQTGIVSNAVEIMLRNYFAGAYPDLAIQGADFYFIFEAKLMSGLAPNQVVPYARSLLNWQQQNPNGRIALFIIGTRKSVQGLVDEAQRQLTNNGMTGVPVQRLAWDEIADRLRGLSQQTQDKQLAVYIQDFADVVFTRLGEPERPFTPEEVQLLSDDQVGMAIQRVWFLADKLIEKVKPGLQFPLEYRRTAGPFWVGFNLWNQQKGLGWLGVWVDAWAEIGKTPLFYQLPDAVRPYLQEIEDEATKLGYPGVDQFDKSHNWMVVPLPINSGSLDDLSTFLANIVIGYIKLVDPRIP